MRESPQHPRTQPGPRPGAAPPPTRQTGANAASPSPDAKRKVLGEVELRDLDLNELPAARHDSPEHQAEARDLARALADAMRTALTPHQRRIAIALLVDGIPIDVLADRLGTSRGALYKTVHDARIRLRADLTSRGYLPDTT